MRLLQSVLSCLKQTKQPQHKFVTHLLGLMLMLPGHATFRNMSRYSPYHERTFARWYGRNFDWVSLNQAAITEIVPPEHDQVVSLQRAGKYQRLAWRPSQEQKGIDERALMASLQPSPPS